MVKFLGDIALVLEILTIVSGLLILGQKASSANAPVTCFNNAFFYDDGLRLDLESAIELCSGS